MYETSVKAIGTIGGDKAIDVLVMALRNQEYASGIRRGAAQALGKARPVRPDTVKTLIQALEDKEISVQSSAIEALGYIGPEAQTATPALIKKMNEKDASHSCSVARALGRIGPADIVIPALINHKDENWEVRDCMVEGLSFFAAEAVPYLVEAVKNKSPKANWALVELSPMTSNAIPELIEMLKNEKKEVRSDVAITLGRMRPPAIEAIPTITLMFEDEDKNIRSAAATALGWMGSAAEEALPALIKATKDESREVKIDSITALGGIRSQKATDTLVDSLDDEDVLIVIHATKALGEIRDKRAINGISKLLDREFKPDEAYNFHPKFINVPTAAHHALISITEESFEGEKPISVDSKGKLEEIREFWQKKLQAKAEDEFDDPSVPPERIVHFRKHGSMGMLYVQPWGWELNTDNEAWEELGEALGDVVVPAAKKLSLVISPDGLNYLSPLTLLRPDDLYQLSLHGNMRTGELKQLKKLTGLRVLEFCSGQITDEQLAHLGDLEGLWSLSLFAKDITDEGIVHLEGMKSLRYLYFGDTKVTIKGIQRLQKLLPDCTIAHNILERGLRCLLRAEKRIWRDGEVPKLFADIENLGDREFLIHQTEQLCELNVDGLWYEQREISAKSSPFPPGRRYNDIQFTLGKRWYKKNSDEHLKLSTGEHTVRVRFPAEPVNTTNGTVRFVSNPVKIEILPKKAIDNTGDKHITPDDKQALRELLKLGASDIKYDDYGRVRDVHLGKKTTEEALMLLKGLPAIRTLSLSSARISQVCLKHLRELKTLEHLSFYGARVTDEGLANLKGLKNLRKLQLSSNQITDAGLLYLNNMSNLEILDISGNNITDAGMRNLRDFSMTSLFLLKNYMGYGR